LSNQDIVFFEDIFSYKQKETRLLGKENMKQCSETKDLLNEQLMPKLNQGVRDQESLNSLIQTS